MRQTLPTIHKRKNQHTNHTTIQTTYKTKIPQTPEYTTNQAKRNEPIPKIPTNTPRLASKNTTTRKHQPKNTQRKTNRYINHHKPIQP